MRTLPGTPDIVLRKYKLVIFVHGCFWHQHKDCRKARRPSSNMEFWNAKFDRNVNRDKTKILELVALGWNVFVIWQCDLERDAEGTVKKITSTLKETI